MITIKELCKGELNSIPQEHEWNLQRLFWCLNVIRREFKKPMFITSGYRSEEEHDQIYKVKNEQRMRQGLNPLPIPLSSCHLFGAAADVFDPHQEIQQFVLANAQLLDHLDLYCEEFQATPNWVHFQIYPPESGARFFKP